MMDLFDLIGQGSKGISVGLRMSETKGNDVFLFNIALFLFSCTMLSHIVIYVLWKLLSGSLILLFITLELRIISQNI